MKIAVKNIQKRIRAKPELIKRVIRAAYAAQGQKKSGEITVCLVDDKTIKKLNLRYLGRNKPTDVMAFNLRGGKKTTGILADIVVSADRAVYNSRFFGTSPLFELYLYVAHGALHLCGYDDRTKKQKKLMEARANRILTVLNIKPPG